jgi:hypothetical protein
MKNHTVEERLAGMKLGNEKTSAMTKREHFIACAMQGLLSNPDKHFDTRNDVIDEAMVYADIAIREIANE